MNFVEYRKKNVGIIERGVDLWRRTGMEISDQEKKNVASEWGNGRMPWEFYDKIEDFCESGLENIPLDYSESVLADLKTIVNDRPPGLPDIEARETIVFILSLSGPFIGLRNLFEDKETVRWLNALAKRHFPSWIFDDTRQLHTLKEMEYIFEKIDDDHHACKEFWLILATNRFKDKLKRMDAMFRKVFHQPMIEFWELSYMLGRDFFHTF